MFAYGYHSHLVKGLRVCPPMHKLSAKGRHFLESWWTRFVSLGHHALESVKTPPNRKRKKNKLKTRRLALSHAFQDAHAEGKWRLSWLKAQTVHIRHLLTWESLSKSWWVIGSYLWQSINGIRILQNAQSQVSRRISDEAVGCDSMYSQCIDFSNLPNRDEHVAAHRTFLSWKISKKLEPSVAAPEYTCLIVPILKCGKSSNYCENQVHMTIHLSRFYSFKVKVILVFKSESTWCGLQ